jgi:hypothetical protein
MIRAMALPAINNSPRDEEKLLRPHLAQLRHHH